MSAATAVVPFRAPPGPYPPRGRQAGCSSTAWRLPSGSQLPGPPWGQRQQGGRRPTMRRAEERGPSEGPRLNIRVPQSRTASSPPPPVSIMHSSTFNLRDGEEEQETGGPIGEAEVVSTQRSLTGPPSKSSVDAFLRSVDDGLSSYEKQPPEAAKVFWSIANGPVGEAAGKGLRGAAKLSVTVGKEAIKVGAPAAGWAMKQGAKAAISLIAKSNEKKDKKPKQK